MILGSCHIDHTNLKPTASVGDIRKLCNEAIEYEFRGVCVHPCHVNTAFQCLREHSDIKLIGVVGFPLGANTTDIKLSEAEEVISHGVDEIDVVWDIGAFRSKEYLRTTLQLGKIVETLRNDFEFEGMIKVIVEICYLSVDDLVKAYQVVLDSGADCIKTSTGFGPNINLKPVVNWYAVKTWNAQRKSGRGDLKIKASAGIRSRETAQYLVDCGADILGTSSGVKIMNGQ